MPIIRVAAVVLECEDAKMVRQDTVVDRVGKSWHEVVTDVSLNHTPPFGGIQNDADGSVDGVEKLRAKRRNTPFVKLNRLNEFRFGIGMMNQAYSMACRAACMTSSWVRPATTPDDSSWSRRMATLTASRSSVSAKPASMLSQSICASETRSESGSAIAFIVSC